MDIAKKHQNKIKQQNKKYPLMDYFLSNKDIKDCSKDCQLQYRSIKND